MPVSITIVGQGLAGTLLGWELERNGVDFEIFEAGAGSPTTKGCASAVAAGIVNPITGQRIVKSWRVDELLPLARQSYRRLEGAWGVSVWGERRVRRLWTDAREPGVFAVKRAKEELAPFAGEADAEGFWIEGAGQVDVPALLAAARERWRSQGRLVEESVDAVNVRRKPGGLTIWCTGAALPRKALLEGAPWVVAKGELLNLSVEPLAPDVILNRGHWILPTAQGHAKVGATYSPGADDLAPSSSARAQLEQSARQILTGPFNVIGQEVGLRLTVTDKHPVAGRIPGDSESGVMGALGSKGVLLAPWLARQWWKHLSEGVPFDPAVDVARFAGR